MVGTLDEPPQRFDLDGPSTLNDLSDPVADRRSSGLVGR